MKPISDFFQVLRHLSEESLHVLDAKVSRSSYVPINLSVSNVRLKHVDTSSSLELEKFIEQSLEEQNGRVGYGGYLEVRNIYNRSHHFNNLTENLRNIHLGIDLWCQANTAILAPLDAKVHSFANNANYGDYGPTIILEHSVLGSTFYTLYGHLSLASIEYLQPHQCFSKGECIGTLGTSEVNGDYPPHLHFQIIKDLEGHHGDYPGVSSKHDLEFYKANCPDPNIMLKFY